jgi:hypothetical protein
MINVPEEDARRNGRHGHSMRRSAASVERGHAAAGHASRRTIRRVIAMRTFGVTAGAKRLGLKHSSLSQWARNKKRRLST